MLGGRKDRGRDTKPKRSGSKELDTVASGAFGKGSSEASEGESRSGGSRQIEAFGFKGARNSGSLEPFGKVDEASEGEGEGGREPPNRGFWVQRSLKWWSVQESQTLTNGRQDE